MSKQEKKLKTCSKGHKFMKSSDCPVCPTCEKEKSMLPGFPKMSAPARRAIQNAGISALKQLTRYTEAEIAALHGMGPKALKALVEALDEKGLALKTK